MNIEKVKIFWQSVCIVAAIFLFVSLLFFLSELKADMSYCQTANDAAKEQNRRTLLTDKDGNHELLLNKGECKDGICVIAESYFPCGGIEQHVDYDGDGTCDDVLFWTSIVDPKYGVYWGLWKHDVSKCGTMI